MAVDVSTVVPPAQDSEQLNRVGQTLESQKQRQLVRAEKETKEERNLRIYCHHGHIQVYCMLRRPREGQIEIEL